MPRMETQDAISTISSLPSYLKGKKKKKKKFKTLQQEDPAELSMMMKTAIIWAVQGGSH